MQGLNYGCSTLHIFMSSLEIRRTWNCLNCIIGNNNNNNNNNIEFLELHMIVTLSTSFLISFCVSVCGILPPFLPFVPCSPKFVKNFDPQLILNNLSPDHLIAIKNCTRWMTCLLHFVASLVKTTNVVTPKNLYKWDHHRLKSTNVCTVHRE